MNEQQLTAFLAAVDQLCAVAMSAGCPPQFLAGALLARVQQLYLADGAADLQGLERLLQHALEGIQNRPRFDID